MSTIKRALISVSNKKGVVEFAKALQAMGIEILSTGGTAKSLRDAGVPVKDVSEHTGSPEMLDGRVKTLHPKIHGGLLSRRDNPKDMEEIKKHGIDAIDMVVVNLYPFEETIAKPGVTFDEAIENIDIGGPAMLRSASKNFKDVAVIVDPSDYERVITEMRNRDGDLTQKTRLDLAKKVFRHTSRYDSLIADYLTKATESGQ
jgi:phosphoribosylaminoimidazolecarboxamide formyltransferase/IMP cyclohydrolase